MTNYDNKAEAEKPTPTLDDDIIRESVERTAEVDFSTDQVHVVVGEDEPAQKANLSESVEEAATAATPLPTRTPVAKAERAPSPSVETAGLDLEAIRKHIEDL